jgi:hypothetical protein
MAAVHLEQPATPDGLEGNEAVKKLEFSVHSKPALAAVRQIPAIIHLLDYASQAMCLILAAVADA